MNECEIYVGPEAARAFSVTSANCQYLCACHIKLVLLPHLEAIFMESFQINFNRENNFILKKIKNKMSACINL
jgi:hypothetical protein